MLEELLTLTNLLIMAILLVNLITLIVLIVHINKSKSVANSNQKGKSSPAKGTINDSLTAPPEIGAVFCRNCGNQYESSRKACPKCETVR